MSAFVVSKDHIDLLVQAALAGPRDAVNWPAARETFRWYHDGQSRLLDEFATEVGGAKPGPLHGFSTEIVTPSQFGQILLSECVRSVHHRYPDTNADLGDLPGPATPYYTDPYIFEPVVESNQFVLRPGMPRAIEPPATIAEIAKQISHYEYQSCEHDEWESSEAHTICRSMKDQLLASLPGYDTAPWGWDMRQAA